MNNLILLLFLFIIFLTVFEITAERIRGRGSAGSGLGDNLDGRNFLISTFTFLGIGLFHNLILFRLRVVSERILVIRIFLDFHINIIIIFIINHFFDIWFVRGGLGFFLNRFLIV